MPCGAGEVPLEEQGELLQDFSGWISLEWEKAWHPQIEPLEQALPTAAAWFRTWDPDQAADAADAADPDRTADLGPFRASGTVG